MTNFFTKMISRRVTRMTRRELEIQILRLNSIKVQLSPKASFSHVWLNQPFRHIIIILNYQISTVFSTFTYEQGWAVVPGFGGIPVPVPQIPGIGTGTGTQSRGTVGTGTKIYGIPLLKSCGTTNPDFSGQESRSVPGRSRCPGILRDANLARSREARLGGC